MDKEKVTGLHPNRHGIVRARQRAALLDSGKKIFGLSYGGVPPQEPSALFNAAEIGSLTVHSCSNY